MLLCFVGFMVCLHVMDFLAPLPSYLWEATRDWFWFPKIRWEDQIRKSCRQELDLRMHGWCSATVSWWDPPCCFLTAPCHKLSVRATVAEVSSDFALPSAAAEIPWACGCVQANWNAKKQEIIGGASSAQLHVICHPRFQFKLLSQLSSNSDNFWLSCRVFACHCVWHEGHTLLLMPFLV